MSPFKLVVRPSVSRYRRDMSRSARASVGGVCYHVINRGNRRATIFHTRSDYDSFVRLMHRASDRTPIRILAYCLMPNHVHFVLWPNEDGDMSRWLHWLFTSHVVRYNRLRRISGRVWQGRFKAFPIQQDRHLLTVLRYVERNPVRANLVRNAIDWEWSSLGEKSQEPSSSLVSDGPVAKPEGWLELVNEPHSDEELRALRQSGLKSAPFGSEHWVQQTATRLGLESSLRGPGRPKRGHS